MNSKNKKFLEKLIQEEYQKILIENEEDIKKLQRIFKNYKDSQSVDDTNTSTSNNEQLRIDKSNWKEWWKTENNMKPADPEINAEPDAEEVMEMLLDEYDGIWAGNENSVFKQSPVIYIEFYKSVIDRLQEPKGIRSTVRSYDDLGNLTNYDAPRLGKNTTMDPGTFSQTKNYKNPKLKNKYSSRDNKFIEPPKLEINGEDIYLYPDGKVELYYSVDNVQQSNISFWSLENNEKGVEQIGIYQNSSLKPEEFIGYLESKGKGNAYLRSYDKQTDSEEKSADRIQGRLDWLGLVPGIGDLVDIYNASWYLARGKYFESFLSMFAVVPFAGSAVKLGIKNFAKFLKYIPAGRMQKVAKGALTGVPGAVQEFWTLLLKEDGLIKEIAAKAGKSEDAIRAEFKASATEAGKVSKDYLSKLKKYDYLIPDQFQKPMEDLLEKFANFSTESADILEKYAIYQKNMSKFGTGKLTPSFEWMQQMNKLAKGEKLSINVASFINKIGKSGGGGILKKLFSLGTRGTIALKSMGLSEAVLLSINKAFGPVFKPKYFKQSSESYTKLVFNKMSKSRQAISTIAATLNPTDVMNILGGQTKFIQNYYLPFIKKTKGSKAKDIQRFLSGPGWKETMELYMKNPAFWKNPVISNELINAGTVAATGGMKATTKSKQLLKLAAESQNTAFYMFFNNKAWQMETLFNNDIIRIFQDKGIASAFKSVLKEYNIFKSSLAKGQYKGMSYKARKALDIFYNEYRELMGQLGIGTERDVNNPDAVVVPIFMLGINTVSSVLGGSETISQEKLRAGGAKYGEIVNNSIDPIAKNLRDFGKIIPFSNGISDYIYDELFVKNFTQVARDVDGKLKIPRFRMLDATFWTLAGIMKKENSDFKWTDPNAPQEILTKIFDKYYWNEIPKDIKDKLTDFRELFGQSLVNKQKELEQKIRKDLYKKNLAVYLGNEEKAKIATSRDWSNAPIPNRWMKVAQKYTMRKLSR
jgi:hypothetical protein